MEGMGSFLKKKEKLRARVGKTTMLSLPLTLASKYL
jgi:hypothetical protein